MAGSISPHLSASSTTTAAFAFVGAAAGALATRVMGAFSSANTGTSASAEPLTPERVFSHAEILEILKREDILANPNAPVKEWGIPPLLKIAELLVQFESLAIGFQRSELGRNFGSSQTASVRSRCSIDNSLLINSLHI